MDKRPRNDKDAERKWGKMKRLSFILIVSLTSAVFFVLLSCGNLKKQSEQDLIKQTFYDYTAAINNKEFEKAQEYIYPKYFDYFSKDNNVLAEKQLMSDSLVSFDSD